MLLDPFDLLLLSGVLVILPAGQQLFDTDLTGDLTLGAAAFLHGHADLAIGALRQQIVISRTVRPPAGPDHIVMRRGCCLFLSGRTDLLSGDRHRRMLRTGRGGFAEGFLHRLIHAGNRDIFSGLSEPAGIGGYLANPAAFLSAP